MTPSGKTEASEISATQKKYIHCFINDAFRLTLIHSIGIVLKSIMAAQSYFVFEIYY